MLGLKDKVVDFDVYLERPAYLDGLLHNKNVIIANVLLWLKICLFHLLVC